MKTYNENHDNSMVKCLRTMGFNPASWRSGSKDVLRRTVNPEVSSSNPTACINCSWGHGSLVSGQRHVLGGAWVKSLARGWGISPTAVGIPPA